jgi:SAM-dependent methyltransferase
MNRQSSILSRQWTGPQPPDEAAFRKGLAAECLRSLRTQTGATSPTDSGLLQQVVGAGGTAAGYLYGGWTTSVGLRAILRLVNHELGEFGAILDWGCGSARTIRWFSDLPATTALHGVDINPAAIAWCREHCRIGTFQHTAPLPPLPFATGSFDLVYGISVLTHLDETFQDAWLDELRRLVAPGGLVMLSIHGEGIARQALPGPHLQKFDTHGFLFEQATGPTVELLPAFYQVAYHSRGYVEQRWCRGFRLLLFVNHGPLYRQSLVVMQRDDSPAPVARPEPIDLPMASLDFPEVSHSCAPGSALEARGWCFGPQQRKVDLRLVLDGDVVGTCAAIEPRPDVGQAFAAYPHAARSGFSSRLSTDTWRPGLRVFWIESDASPIPLAATYLRVDG